MIMSELAYHRELAVLREMEALMLRKVKRMVSGTWPRGQIFVTLDLSNYLSLAKKINI